jgi:hypothetical protein
VLLSTVRMVTAPPYLRECSRERCTHGERPPPPAAPHDGPRPAAAASCLDAARAAVRPDVRCRVRRGSRPVRALPRGGARSARARRVRVLDARNHVGVGQLLLVRIGLRHGRLVLPRDRDGADGRRADPRARAPRAVRLPRPGHRFRQRRDGGRVHRHARRCDRGLAARRPTVTGPQTDRARLRAIRRSGAGRLGRHPAASRDLGRFPAHRRDGRAGVRRSVPRGAQRAEPVARAAHRGTLRAADDHRPRRGRARHDRRRLSRCAARRVERRGGADRGRGNRTHLRPVVDLLHRALRHRAAPLSRAGAASGASRTSRSSPPSPRLGPACTSPPTSSRGRRRSARRARC